MMGAAVAPSDYYDVMAIHESRWRIVAAKALPVYIGLSAVLNEKVAKSLTEGMDQ